MWKRMRNIFKNLGRTHSEKDTTKDEENVEKTTPTKHFNEERTFHHREERSFRFPLIPDEAKDDQTVHRSRNDQALELKSRKPVAGDRRFIQQKSHDRSSLRPIRREQPQERKQPF